MVIGGRRTEDRLVLGRKGEDVAVRYLTRLGVTILSRNWRCREGELDIVGKHGDTVMVCEVKTRSGLEFGRPEEAVTREKAARIRRLSARWLSEAGTRDRGSIRYDVIAVLWPPGENPVVRHIRGAF